MSNKREPLLSDTQLICGHDLGHNMVRPLSGHEVRNTYEAARAKDAELIQLLVDAGNAAAEAMISLCAEHGGKGDERKCDQIQNAWQSAIEASGFKPSDE